MGDTVQNVSQLFVVRVSDGGIIIHQSVFRCPGTKGRLRNATYGSGSTHAEIPLIPRGCEKKFAVALRQGSGRTAKYCEFSYASSVRVRLSNHERIFSQLPFRKRGNSLRYSFNRYLRKFEKEGKGRFLVQRCRNYSTNLRYATLANGNAFKL